MRTLFTLFTTYFIILLVNVFTANCQQIKLTQLPILQDATWLVTSISQDPQGYMWFGTKRTGVYRYDGYNITSYKNQVSNPNTLAYDAIESLHADNTGIIWIGTFGRGLDRLDPASGNFTHYRFAANDAASLSNDTVTAILEDKDENLWIGTYGGISHFNKKTGKFTSYHHIQNDPSSLSCNQVRTIYQDTQGTIWVGTGSAFNEQHTCDLGGLNRFDKNKNKFTRYLHNANDPGSLIDNRVRAILEDKHGTFYVGTAGDGLHTMDRKTGKFIRHTYDPMQPEKLSRPRLRKSLGYVEDHITFINEDVTGAIWIGTFAGVNRYDPQTKKIKYYQSFNDSASGDKDNIGWMAYTSRDGVLWFSTLGKGNIYHVDPFLKKIDHYDIGDQVNSIYKDSEDIFWLGTQLTGLIRKDRANGTQKGFPFPDVMSVTPNNQGQFWIGTIDGLFLFHPKTQAITTYKSGLSTTALYVNRQGSLWMGTARGLGLLDTQSGSISYYAHIPNDTNSLSDNSVTSILEDKQGRLWVGTHPDGGLNLLNKQTEKFKHYLKGRGITGTIYQDLSGTIWVGAHDGLYRFSPQEDIFSLFADPYTGASLNFILNILEDDKKNLWVVTGEELIKINERRNEIIRFGKNEGVKPNTGHWGNFSGGNGHEVFYGDQSGYYIFDPSRLTVNARPPQILLTDFSIKDNERKINLTNLLNKSPLEAKQINLNHNENFFSFSLVAIHYSNTQDNRLIYMLENYDKTWRESGIGQKAYYFNVPPGRYILKVKAANGNGVWTQKDIALNITPPWWQTWWAYILMGLAFTGCIWLFIFYRSRNLINEKKVLEQKVNFRTKEVVQQKEEISAQRDQLKQALNKLQNTQTQLMVQKEEISSQRDQLEQALKGLQNTQAQLIQREKMASLGELTAGIAHEIQNPLNFVKNFSEVNIELLAEIDEAIAKGDVAGAKLIAADIKQNLEKVTHHGKRADSIVKGMLHHSRNSTDKKELTDINDLADECLRLTYHGLRAKDKSFNAKMQIEVDKSIEKINVIPQDIGRVFLNLFTNAFYSVIEKQKQSDNGYQPTVLVSTKALSSPSGAGGNIEISIKDNGTGIPKNVLDKIYRPFFTTKPTGQGTGLGLALSYDIIKAHGGEIKVETKEGEGAEFLIQLPVT